MISLITLLDGSSHNKNKTIILIICSPSLKIVTCEMENFSFILAENYVDL